MSKIFDPKKLQKLNNPERLKMFPIKDVITLLELKNPEAIIDLGAGTGFFSIPFAESFPECVIFACDISPVMIDWIEQNVLPTHDNIRAIIMKNNDVPLENEFADFLFMVNLHHELDEPLETLKECFRLIKPYGKIAISDWKKEKTEFGPPLEHRCEPADVLEQLSKSGFLNINVHKHFQNNFLITAQKNA